MGSYPALDVEYAPGPDTGTLHDLLYAELDAFEPLAIQDLEARDGWRVFFRTSSQRDRAQAALESALGGRLLTLSPADVDDEDWARRSQAALTAIRVGRITVAPPWDVPGAQSRTPNLEPADPESRVPSPGIPSPDPRSPIPNPGFVIVIEPSMGFGTGHHATTRLCLELLQTLPLAGARVIDVGTGSGVLAIAAAMLGASHVVAIDHDPDALQNARENIATNGDTHLYGKSLTGGDHPAHRIEVVEGELGASAGYVAEIVLANLTAAVLRRHAATLRGMVAPAGVLIVSGFSPEEMDDVAGALGMSLSESRREGEWAAATLSTSLG